MKGVKGYGDMSVGQDFCSISVLPSGWHVYCLFDGHGSNGHWPAERASRTLPYLLEATQACSTMLRQDRVEAALYHAFEKVQMDLVRQSIQRDFELQVCGSTAVCVMQHPRHDKIWAATLGDSRAVLLVPGKGAVAQTNDHKPSVETEQSRVESLGVEIQRQVHEDGFVEERLFIVGEDFPGLCMTRSLGDLCVKDHGVIAEPEVICWNISNYPDSYVLIASDGIWDCFTSDEVGDLEPRPQTSFGCFLLACFWCVLLRSLYFACLLLACSASTDQVLDSISAGDSLELATSKVLETAKERWRDYEEHYCASRSFVASYVHGYLGISW